jgi:hypothetical protein
MPRLTPVELAHLRNQHPHTARVNWYLAVAPYGSGSTPTPCFTATVNDAAITRGARAITYAGGVAANVNTEDYPGLTLWVGTAAGQRDLGTVRVRAVTGAPGAPPGAAGTLTVAENDDIAWVNGAHLTCPGAYGFRELWGIYQRITEAGGAVNFFQDYDVNWAAADATLPPKANAGPPVVAWIDPATGNADVDFIGQYSYTLETGAAIAAYAWDFADGVIIAGAANVAGTRATPNTVRWTTSGFRYVYLEVTDDTADARTHIVYVPVWIFEAGVEDPYELVEVLSQDAAPSWTARFKVTETDAAAEDIIYNFPDRAMVVLFTKTEFGGTEAAVGKWFGPADVQQGALTCDPGGVLGVDDAGQDFTDWETAPPGDAAFLIVVFDASGDEIAWGYCGNSFNGGTSIAAYQDAGLTTTGWADGACAGLVAYEIWEVDANANYRARSDVRFVGWLDEETLNFNFEAGTVEFSALAHDGVLDKLPGFAFTLEDDDTPGDWYEIDDLNVDRALHHLLLYHSTAANICHVEVPGEGNNRPIAIQAFPDASIYAQAQEHLLGDAKCLLLSDRQGILRASRDPQFLDATDRALVVVDCTFTDPDWMNEFEEPTPHRPEVGSVRLGGFEYNTPLLSLAPGDAPVQNENETRAEGHILQDQDEANRWSGQQLAQFNNPFPNVPVELSGYWPVFDPAYQEYIWLTVTDPLSRYVWADEPLIVREVSFRDMSSDATTGVELTLESVTTWLDGETQSIPANPPPDDPEWPEPPEIEEWEMWEGPVKACVAFNKKQIGYTDDLLRHHVLSVAGAGTGGIDLFDFAVDFIVLEIAVGDLVEEPITHTSTTVAAVVGPNQLTLNANIGLGVGSWYHIGMPLWESAVGGIDVSAAGANEDILQFLYTRTGQDSVGGWVLTDQNLYYSSNVLTASPGWSVKLRLTDVRAQSAFLAAAEFRGMHAKMTDPNWLIVSFSETTVNDGTAHCYGTVYTTDCGGSWTFSRFEAPLLDAGVLVNHGKVTRHCPYYALEVDDAGVIYHIRCGTFTGVGPRSYVYISFDGGAIFQGTDNPCSGACWETTHAGLYLPHGGGNLYCTIREDIIGNEAVMLSLDGGNTWAGIDPPGYGAITGLPPSGGKTGANGWYGDATDWMSLYEDIAGGVRDQHLLRKDALIGLAGRDGGGGLPNECFNGNAGIFAGSVSIVPQTWPPDELVMIWTGVSESLAGGTQRRIMYTPDNGGSPGGAPPPYNLPTEHWCNKMGNWYLNPDFDYDGDGNPEWCGAAGGASGATGGVDCIPLPRVGSNA